MRSGYKKTVFYILLWVACISLLAVCGRVTNDGGVFVFSYADGKTVSDGGRSFESFFTIDKQKNQSFENMRLCPGGSTFGVKLLTDGVVVAGTTELTANGKTYSPAYDAGLRAGDIMIKINGKTVKSVSEVTRAIEGCEGQKLEFICKRNGKEERFDVFPAYCRDTGKYKLGIWIRDNTAGIGTVTFINPQTGEFGGLGHGIYDVDTGELLPLSRGVVTDVNITGIIKGEAGKPGEIRGYLKNGKRGALLENNDCGVFGIYTPSLAIKDSETLPVAHRSEVKEGKVTILTTINSEGIKEYQAEISKIGKNGNNDTKNFVISINDKDLINTTGGIIQGMSGSPILQNGKLVGAVTHVLVNDPTRGYGIFIQNMLEAA